MYRNSEGYADPTAGEALANIAREMRRENRQMHKRQNEVTHRPRVYVVSRFAGDVVTNVKQARKFCRFVARQKKIPFASHLLYPQFLNDMNPKERELGLYFGLSMLRCCAEVWCFGTEHSTGMRQELEEAERQHKPVRYFTTEMEEIR